MHPFLINGVGCQLIPDLWSKSEIIAFANNFFYWDLLNGADSYADDLPQKPQRAFLRALDRGDLGFRRIRFAHYPSIAGWEINDDWVETSFSWMDHPPVTIYLRDPAADQLEARRRLD